MLWVATDKNWFMENSSVLPLSLFIGRSGSVTPGSLATNKKGQREYITIYSSWDASLKIGSSRDSHRTFIRVSFKREHICSFSTVSLRKVYVDDQNWHWSNRPVWPVLESGLTGLNHVAGLATPTGLTSGSDRSDRSTWNPSTTRTLCRFRFVIWFLAG